MTLLIGALDWRRVRVSLLWKALTFANEDAARVYDEHEDDLDVDTIVSVFADDLAKRGLRVDAPEDPLADPTWSKVLTATYMRRR